MTFDLVLNDTVIGKALAPRFSVAGFSLTFRPEAAAGRFNPDIFKENPQLYSDFLMALQQPTGNSMLALRGANVTADGKEVSWMIPSIQKVEIPFQIPSLEAETPQNTTRDIDMTFTIVENGTSRAIRSGYIGTEVVLPAFASAAVQTLNNSAYSLQFMSVDNQDLAIVNIPPAQAPVVVDENFINRTISEAEIAVTDEVLYANRFLRPIIHNNTVTFLVSGNASAEVDTAVGRATLPARVPQQELMVRGLNGLRNGASLRDIRVLGADNQSVVLSTIMSFSSASQVGISVSLSVQSQRPDILIPFS